MIIFDFIALSLSLKSFIENKKKRTRREKESKKLYIFSKKSEIEQF